VVEHGPQVVTVRFLSEHEQEAGHIPAVGDLILLVSGDADEHAEVVVAAQLGEASLEVDVAEGDGEQDDAPQDRHGVVIAAVAAGLAEAVEQGGIGDGGEEAFEGGERRAVLEGVPGKEGLAEGGLHR
jgi:hypothetical protein